MATLHTLASGSSGNALVISCGETHLLVDAGISCRRITLGLQALGLAPADLDAIFITHTHTDHISGLSTLFKRTTCPIRTTERVCRELEYRIAGLADRFLPLTYCRPCGEASFTVTAFPTSHDAPGSCGFRFDTADGSVGVLTDTGYVTEEASDLLAGVNLAVLEANHDVESLRSGPYPYYLKQRILGAEGHLCNEDAARFAAALARSGTSEVVLAHLSRENNTPAMALHAVESALCAAGLPPCTEGSSTGPRVTIAPREALSEAHVVARRGLCRR